MINDPPGRFDEILARQLDTPEKFLQFLAQLLGLDGAAIFGLGSAGEAGGFGEFGISPTGIFELMVRALADKPGALDTLADLIPRLAGNPEQDLAPAGRVSAALGRSEPRSPRHRGRRSMTARKRFDAAPILEGLKDFQRNTVAHIMDRFYGDHPTTRFLVADETGLGKSIVARGVIAGLIEKLQDADNIDRIDVVYVCSNLDLARQNLARLDVIGEGSIPFTSRLSLLATESGRLAEDDGQWRKPIKLVSFTPGTSFDPGWSTGTARERALLFLLLQDRADLQGARRTAALRVLQGGVASWTRFRESVDYLDWSLGAHGPDRQIASRFCGRSGEIRMDSRAW